MKVSLKNFLVPRQLPPAHRVYEPVISAIVPTYKPGAALVHLVEDLLRYNPKLQVVVVDDCTPQDYAPSVAVLERLRTLGPRVTLLRTPQNRLKAGALNLALGYLLADKGPRTPAVILTLDDDVVVAPGTIAALVRQLLANPGLGAVCSHCAVLNKNKNLLTRLQGLEYVGFNAIRLGDQGFMHGPLVMHGMLTAFRARALRQAGPFAERHLIEDYEMTTRLKVLGWDVRAVLDAPAHTEVPETLARFLAPAHALEPGRGAGGAGRPRPHRGHPRCFGARHIYRHACSYRAFTGIGRRRWRTVVVWGHHH